MNIKATCIGTRTIKLEEAEFFQNDNFKTLTKESFEKLKNSLKKHGIFVPLYFWRDKKALCDGHHRVRALRELKKEGFEIDDLPAIDIEAKDEKELAEKILLINSKYARITDEGLHDFVNQFDLNIEELKFEIDLPEIDLDYELEDFSDKNKEIDIEDLGKDLDTECPKCHFMFKK